MFCKHEWVILSEHTTESQLEHLRNAGGNPKSINGFMLDRKFIQIVTCKKCGKLKRFVEEI